MCPPLARPEEAVPAASATPPKNTSPSTSCTSLMSRSGVATKQWSPPGHSNTSLSCKRAGSSTKRTSAASCGSHLGAESFIFAGYWKRLDFHGHLVVVYSLSLPSRDRQQWQDDSPEEYYAEEDPEHKAQEGSHDPNKDGLTARLFLSLGYPKLEQAILLLFLAATFG